MRLKLIACKVLYREISLLSARTNNIIDTTYLRQGYHNTPEKLHRLLQNEIDNLDNGDDVYSYQPRTGQDFDAILLGYGLCSNAIVGLKSKRYPIVVPKAHDCITLFLGSKDAYKNYFNTHNGGIYWYTPGWIEQSQMPGQERVERLLREYTEKYGEDNAEYLMEMEQNWMKEYTYCTYVNWEQLKNNAFISYTKQCAEYMNWTYDQVEGSPSLLENLLSGNWNRSDFLIVPPGGKISTTYDDEIIKAEESK